ncbi:unnamed protein product, partial [Linum tenue]
PEPIPASEIPLRRRSIPHRNPQFEALLLTYPTEVQNAGPRLHRQPRRRLPAEEVRRLPGATHVRHRSPHGGAPVQFRHGDGRVIEVVRRRQHFRALESLVGVSQPVAAEVEQVVPVRRVVYQTRVRCSRRAEVTRPEFERRRFVARLIGYCLPLFVLYRRCTLAQKPHRKLSYGGRAPSGMYSFDKRGQASNVRARH